MHWRDCAEVGAQMINRWLSDATLWDGAGVLLVDLDCRAHVFVLNFVISAASNQLPVCGPPLRAAGRLCDVCACVRLLAGSVYI